MRKEVLGSGLIIFVIFFAQYALANTSPTIENLDNEIFACESSAFSYEFDVTEYDSENLNFDIFQKDLFFIRNISKYENKTKAEIFSGKLDKTQARKSYERTVYVSDANFLDSKNTKITVIEINNPPKIEDIGAITLTLNESNRLVKKILVNDTEDGNQDSGNLSFILNFLSGEEIFEISHEGLIDYRAKSEDIGSYEIEVCVSDSALEKEKIHKKINLCNQDGSSQTSCKKFNLAIVENNKAPTILEHYPKSANITAFGTDNLFFNITKFDPEKVIPDTHWYVDNELKKIDLASQDDRFSFSFGCGVSGKHTVKTIITDSLLNDSLEWKIDVQKFPCPSTDVLNFEKKPGCNEKLACYDWQICQHANQSFKVGILAQKDYQTILNSCSKLNLREENCGFQIRNCFDINNCNIRNESFVELQACYFSINPSCSDDIKNCHSNSCEFLVDCGGPCKTCPTCSDGIKNQGEEGIDCGGTCTELCPLREKTRIEKFIERKNVQYAILAIIILLVPIMAIILIRVSKMKKFLQETNLKEKISKNGNK